MPEPTDRIFSPQPSFLSNELKDLEAGLPVTIIAGSSQQVLVKGTTVSINDSQGQLMELTVIDTREIPNGVEITYQRKE